MKYNFNQVYDRRMTDCLKWDSMEPLFGCSDLIPLWVADMDFPVAQPVVEALKKRADHPFYGYTKPGTSVIESVVDRIKRKFNWEINSEWIVFTPGVVPALNVAIRSLTHPGDEIILQEPAYHPFFPTIKGSGCQIINNDLKLVNNQYEMDFKGLKQVFQSQTGRLNISSRIKAILFCNPHNPVGRVWNREEIIEMGEIILENQAVVISDEIHCEILFKGYKHIPFGSICEEFQENSITCMSPSKTFNLPGLGISTIIIPDEKLRNNFKDVASGIMPDPNLFGYTALEAAYRYGDEWLDQILDYLQKNLDFLMEYLHQNIPEVKVIKPHGTYLIWLDFRGLNLDKYLLSKFMVDEAKVGLEDGFIFGESGCGFMRMNIACPQSMLEEALHRIEKAINKL